MYVCKKSIFKVSKGLTDDRIKTLKRLSVHAYEPTVLYNYNYIHTSKSYLNLNLVPLFLHLVHLYYPSRLSFCPHLSQSPKNLNLWYCTYSPLSSINWSKVPYSIPLSVSVLCMVGYVFLFSFLSKVKV